MLFVKGTYLLLSHLPTSHTTVHAVPHTAVSCFLISRCVASCLQPSLRETMDETGIRPVMHDDGRYYTLEKEDLISLLNRLCGIDEGRTVQHIIHVFHELDAMFSHTEDGSKGKAFKDFITRKIHGHG